MNEGRNRRGGAGARRRMRRVLGGCLLVMAMIAAGLPVYVFPQLDPLRRADAILILGGAHYLRYPFGLDSATRGWAPNVVVSNPRGASDPWLTELCATPNPRYTLHCFTPEPSTTRGEGRELRRLADTHDWRTVIVVTFRPHVSRARFILEKCFDGELIMTAPPGPISLRRWVAEYVYQSAGYLRAVAEPDC